MKGIKLLFQQALMISTCMLLVMGVNGLIARIGGREEIILPWYTPFAIVLTGILCALPSKIFSSKKELSRGAYRIRILIHFLLLFGIVSLAGYLFEWYQHLKGYLFVMASYVIIYLLVWIGSSFLMYRDEASINERLKHIRDEE